ncbi:growth factor receptor-bound protein 2-like [Clinocottus analis]|uniref:growth factor receptor-bound protein 2-like n=1 Tax=Clinocottus analis TaxID=304258 RepID=UPI0035C1E3C5
MEATAKHEYEATAEDELSFRKGELLVVLQASGNWYKAELDGREGFIPKNFITLHLPSWYQENFSRGDAAEKLMQQPDGAFLLRGNLDAAQGNLCISVRHAAGVQHLKVLRDSRGQYFLWSEKFPSLNQLVEHYKHYSISQHSQVLLLETEQQQGLNNGRPLPAPPFSSCPPPPVAARQVTTRQVTTRQVTTRQVTTRQVTTRQVTSGQKDEEYILSQQQQGLNNGRPLPAPPFSSCPPPPVTARQVRAMYSFHAEETDELAFDVGDVISVLECSDPAWWSGRVGGRTGLFPSNYTRPV